MSSLSNLLSDVADQIRIVTVLVSAFVAIFVVLLNQWFLSRRAKRDLLIKKIEDLFSASNEYVAACRELMDSLQDQDRINPNGYYDYQSDSVNKLNDAITKMQMICGLYFRGEKFDPKDFYIWRMPILAIAQKGKSLPEGEAHIAFEDSKAHIASSREKLNNLCKRLMKKHGH